MIKAIHAMYSVVKSATEHNGEIKFYKLKPRRQTRRHDFLTFIININTDLEGLFTIDELKLFLLSYADGQV